MAGPGTVKSSYSFLDTFGGRFFNTVDYSGVAAYVNGTGELLSPNAFGFKNTIQFVWASGTQSGLYYGICFPVNNGVTNWYIRWFVVGTGVEIASGTPLNGQTLKLTAVGF
jgi:hypothetical protein